MTDAAAAVRTGPWLQECYEWEASPLSATDAFLFHMEFYKAEEQAFVCEACAKGKGEIHDLLEAQFPKTPSFQSRIMPLPYPLII